MSYQTALALLADWQRDVMAGTPPTRFPTGIPSFDLWPGTVTLVGGAPGAGKTAFAMQAVVDALRLSPKLRALVVNVEMAPSVLFDRQLARLAGIPLSVIRDRRMTDLAPLGRPFKTLEAIGGRLAFADRPFTLAGISSQVEAFKADLVLLDYVQRLQPAGGTDTRTSVNATMDQLRQWADAGRAVLAVAAVTRSRDYAGRSSYDHLTLASFRESSELEYGADDAWMLVPEDDDNPTVAVTLRHLKARYGLPADRLLEFDRPRQRFSIDVEEGSTP